MPSTPTCRPKSHTREATVAMRKKPMSCLNDSIHAPGRGTKRSQPGWRERTR